MSGYRTIHREQVNKTKMSEEVNEQEQDLVSASASSAPIWQVRSTASVRAKDWRIWMASGDGKVYSYQVKEKQVGQSDDLSAAAMHLQCTHALLGLTQSTQSTPASALGCTQVSMARNYVGEDTDAGDYVLVSMELSGRVRVWTIPQEFDNTTVNTADTETYTTSKTTTLVATHEFHLKQSSGTTLVICPPSLSGNGNIVAAVGCLDNGSVRLVSTGLVTPQCTNDADPPGTVLQTWGGGAIPTRLTWHPFLQRMAVGRQDGTVEIYDANHLGRRLHRLVRHSSPVRAVAFSPDGQILLTGSDEGMLCLWDTNRTKTPALVHHVVLAHNSWILDATFIDKQRFVTAGADQKIHVWSLEQGYAPLHTFHCDAIPWTVYANNNNDRLVVGTDHGWLQICSLDV